MVGYGRERFYERILKIFGFLDLATWAAPKRFSTLSSISLFEKKRWHAIQLNSGR